jgi:hypothetical protein
VEGLAALLAEALLPGDLEGLAGVDVLDRLLGVAARQAPGSGRKKSAPFSDSLGSTFWSKAMTEMR